ncbi:hypothetical protein F4779DRAFT_102479 [Xylariaceae sp. FL0662B]|nr:hypothetical protein F4779DRAFT_102479 [Xylariaceae sp. FL0662B]
MPSASARGCWTCKDRRKKCDGRRPSCYACERLGLECKGYQPRLLWEDDEIRVGMRRRGWRRKCTNERGSVQSIVATKSPAKNAGKPPTPVCQSIPPVAAEESLSAPESLLLGWYVKKFAISYPSFTHERNPFLSSILPIALQSPFLLKATLAVAGTQASREQPHLLPATLQCRIGALRGLRANLSSDLIQTGSVKDIIAALASSLMLFIYEKIECEEKALCSHLSYAASLVAKLVTLCQDFDGDAQFLVRLFIHNDVYASFALRTRPALDCVPPARLSAILGDKTFPRMMASIGRLASAGPVVEDRRDVQELSHALEVWKPSMDWIPSASTWKKTESMTYCARVHRCAAMTSLERLLGRSPDRPRIHEAIEYLFMVPESHPITASLLWPTVVLGAETKDDYQRQRLKARLQMLADKTGYKQYSKAVQLLEDCWTAGTDRDDSNVGWVDVMHNTNNVILCAL